MHTIRSRGGRRATIVFIGLAVISLVSIVPAMAAEAEAEVSVWHRLSVDPTQLAPEHERLHCIERAGAWNCRYSKLPEPTLALQWNRTVGTFSGSELTEPWECPAWFDTAVCSAAATVARGTLSFEPQDGDSFTVEAEIIVTDGDDLAPLYVYWVDQFVCGWYTSFDAALAANPLPGEGGFPPQDCVVAPS